MYQTSSSNVRSLSFYLFIRLFLYIFVYKLVLNPIYDMVLSLFVRSHYLVHTPSDSHPSGSIRGFSSVKSSLAFRLFVVGLSQGLSPCCIQFSVFVPFRIQDPCRFSYTYFVSLLCPSRSSTSLFWLRDTRFVGTRPTNYR